MPGVGFAAGIERIMLALEAAGIDLDFEPLCEVALIHIGAAARQRLFTICDTLRRAGVACTIELFDRSVKAQMREANRREALLALIAGEKELEADTITLRNLVSGDEEQVAFTDVVTSVLGRLDQLEDEAVDEEPDEWTDEDEQSGPGPGEAA